MSLAPGTQIGPYEILASLGAGGMGEVYRARDPRLARHVAIKVLPPELSQDSGAIARFEREARAVAALSHPNILAIFDFGTFEGSSYIVTELLEGETLRQRLVSSSLAWSKTANIAASIAEGIAAAHTRGIVHRDLKPENIFLTTDGQVKILDFGIAAVGPATSGAKPIEPRRLTQAGTILGTLGYMSPEQVRGGPTMASSDIFSLGCVMYEMVSGQPPFLRTTAVETWSAILEHDPPPLSQAGKAAPPEFNRLILRCLEKDPALRVQSARDLSVDLRSLSSPEWLAVSVPRNRSRWRMSVPIAAAVLAAVTLVVLASGPFREWLPGKSVEKPIESLAVLPLKDLSSDATQGHLADGITEALISDLGSVVGLRIIAREAVMPYRDDRPPLEDVARQLNVRALVTGSVSRSDDRIRVTIRLTVPDRNRDIWSESFERGIRNILALQEDITRAIAEQVHLPLGPNARTRSGTAQSVNPEAYQLYLRARYLMGTGTTDQDNQEAIDMLQQATDIDPSFAPAYAVLASAYINRLTRVVPEESRMLEQRAFAAVERALSLDSELAEAYLARGDLLWTPSNRFAHLRAAGEYRRALELNPNLDGACEGLSRILGHAGFFDEALEYAARALRNNPNNGLALWHRAEALLWMGKDEDALAVMATIPRLVLREWVDANVVYASYRLGRREEAWSHLRDAQAKYPGDTSGVLASVEALLQADSRPDDVEKLVAIAARSAEFNPSHHTAHFIACAWARMGRARETVQWLRKAADAGFPCYKLFANDPTLEPIRHDSGFTAFLAELERQSASLEAALLHGDHQEALP